MKPAVAASCNIQLNYLFYYFCCKPVFKVETYGREVRYLFIKAVADEPAVSYVEVYFF